MNDSIRHSKQDLSPFLRSHGRRRVLSPRRQRNCQNSLTSPPEGWHDPRATWFGGSRGATQNRVEAPRSCSRCPTKTGAMNASCASAGARLLGGSRLSPARRWYWTGGTTVWSEALLLKTLRVLEPSPGGTRSAYLLVVGDRRRATPACVPPPITALLRAGLAPAALLQSLTCRPEPRLHGRSPHKPRMDVTAERKMRYGISAQLTRAGGPESG
jgi:hypothetical protein